MTLDILSFIDTKGGNSAEIKESQKKRGLSVELVDEIIQMYADWVKSKFFCHVEWSFSYIICVFSLIDWLIVDYDTNALRKKVNEVQKEISAKKKVMGIDFWFVSIRYTDDGLDQAKQPADELVATKKAQVEEKKKEAREFEMKMRQKASTVGNIVGKNVPVSLTEVSRPFCWMRWYSLRMEGW